MYWLGLKNEIKFWFERTFKTRHYWMPKGDLTVSWSDGGNKDVK